MNNRITKIALTLVMMLALAVPAQVFAADYNHISARLNSNHSFSALCNQLMMPFENLGMTTRSTKQAQTTAVEKLNNTKPAAVASKPAATSSKPAAVTSKPAATSSKPAAVTSKPAAASSNNGTYEQQVVNLVNQERAAAGLSALTVNTKLAGMAEKKAEDLRDNHYFDHNSPVYGSPFDMMRQFGISYKSAGENIAKGQRTPEEVMNGWMNSPGHRANILNSSYTEIGVGYVTDGSGTGYWVQEFIRP